MNPSLRADPDPSKRPSGALADAGAVAVLALLSAALYRRIFDFWWTYDDFFDFRYLSEHSPISYCFDPKTWQLLPIRMLTPGVFLSLHLDLALFGLQARAFYLHHLAALILTVSAFYFLLRRFLPRLYSLAGALLLLLGVPTASIVSTLMTRHYIEGLLLLVLSFLLFRGAGGNRPSAADGLSAALYLAAALEKEVFVPFVALFPLLAAGTARGRLARAAPHAGAFVLYLIWRLRMLGTLGGGYGWAATPADWPRLALALPRKFLDVYTHGFAAPGIVLLALLLVGTTLCSLGGRRQLFLVGAAALAAVAPVVPASTETKPRLALMLWVTLAAAASVGLHSLSRRSARFRLPAAALLAMLPVSALAVNHLAWRDISRVVLRISQENRALVRLGPGNLLRQPASPPASQHESVWFRSWSLGRPPGAGWFQDDGYLCGATRPERLWQYDEAIGKVRERTAEIHHEVARFCASVRPEAPLKVELAHGQDTLRWDLGPYQDGRYWLLLTDGIDAIEVPAHAGFQVLGLTSVTVRVRYTSPDGWSTYSPWLRLDFARRQRLRFARP